MYHTLKQRGFTDKNIIYFNPDFFQDIDGDGKDDNVVDLRRGQTFYNAFQQSEQMIRANPKLFGEQKPQLDDNGDGFYSSTKDGNLAKKWKLGLEGQAQDEPEIIDTQTALTLSP